jgi:hypothetical protein
MFISIQKITIQRIQRLIPYQHLIRTFSFEGIVAENKNNKIMANGKSKTTLTPYPAIQSTNTATLPPFTLFFQVYALPTLAGGGGM